jgi:hypothetical protein
MLWGLSRKFHLFLHFNIILCVKLRKETSLLLPTHIDYVKAFNAEELPCFTSQLKLYTTRRIHRLIATRSKEE